MIHHGWEGHPLRENLTAPRDSLQQAVSPEPLVAPAESVILQYKRERRRNAVSLAEQSVVGGDSVCAKE